MTYHARCYFNHARTTASNYYVSKRQMEEVMHIRGRVPNLESPIECAKKLRSKVMKYAFTKVRAAYGRHPVTLYTRASPGLHEGFTLKQRKQMNLAFELEVILIGS